MYFNDQLNKPRTGLLAVGPGSSADNGKSLKPESTEMVEFETFDGYDRAEIDPGNGP